MKITTETFFRPEEVAREQVNLPAPIFNRCVLLLNHSPTTHVFVPVRTMQIQAVIDTDEIIFVDNHGYAVQDGKGGRLILMAWQVSLHSARDSLNEPVPIEVVDYSNTGQDTHRRLIGEFSKALSLFEEREKTTGSSDMTADILPFHAG